MNMASPPTLVDTHAHLDNHRFDADRQQVVARAREAGVAQIINVGANLVSSQAAVQLARAYPQLYATVGVHPHDARHANQAALAELGQLLQQEEVVAVGEIGLDYYRDLSPRDQQRQAFEAQWALAQQVDKPVVIHSRKAHQDMLSMLGEWTNGTTKPWGVMHCFSGDSEMAAQLVEWGFFIGIDGPVTFRNAQQLVEVVREIDLAHLLVETDCPYLTPQPHRGQRNEPAYTLYIAERIAEIKGVSLSRVAEQTTANARDLFGLEK